jgi:molybdate transport system substrate-binding protein
VSKILSIVILALSFFIVDICNASADVVRVFAAASLNNALQEAADDFENEYGIEVRLSFASSSTLARQIELGAPADVFISANPSWMNYLQKRQLVVDSSRVDLLGNSLVVVAPTGEELSVEVWEEELSTQFDGRLAIADPDHVPAGIYAKQAMVWLGWWNGVEDRLAVAADVRAALVFVERGACQIGIVYATDAMASKRIRVLSFLPKTSHDPIVYPAAVIKGGSGRALELLAFLQSKAAFEVFRSYGFAIP